jgi:hypothetical protein
MVMGVADESCHSQQVSPFTELAPGRTINVDDVTDRRKANGPPSCPDPPTPVRFLATVEVPRIEWADVAHHLSPCGEVAPGHHVDVTLAISKPMRHALSPESARPPEFGQPSEAEEGIQN